VTDRRARFPVAAARGIDRWAGPTALGLAAAAVIVFVWVLVTPFGQTYLDWDRAHYMAAAGRWLTTGSPYLASEVAAPFDYQPDSFLHPPIALWLFVGFRMLPPLAWYVAPVGIILWSVVSWRPMRRTWPVIAACLAWPRTPAMLIVGNTDLWVSAFVALGLRWGWGWALIALKPSFAPVALIGVRRRAYWVAVGVLIVISVPFGRLWLDWLSVVLHAPGGILYSILGLPLVLLPAVAYAGRTRHGRRAPAGQDRPTISPPVE
jgi:hypothetical protein